jgi:hypothetical protein
MAEIVYIQPPQQQVQSAPEGTLERILGWIVRLGLILVGIALVVSAYLVVDNWEWVVTTLTTGFLGWLNPFDSDADDTSPNDIADSVVDDYVRTPLSLAWWWPGNWF